MFDSEKQAQFNEIYAERKKVRLAGIITGFPLLAAIILSAVMSPVTLLILKSVRLNNSDAAALLSDPAFLQAVNSVCSVILFLIPFLIAVKLSGQRISTLIPFEKPKGNVLGFILLGIGFCGFANISVSYGGALFDSLGFPSYNYPSSENAAGIFGFLLTVISTAVIPPLTEEFAFRGAVLGELKKHGEGFALITSSVLFGLMHRNFIQIFFAFLVGLILGFIRIKTGSIWVSIAVHALNNFLAVICDYLTDILPKSGAILIYPITNIIYMLLGITGLLYVSKAEGFFKLEGGEEKALTTKKVYSLFFTTVPIILFCAGCLIEAVLYFFV